MTTDHKGEFRLGDRSYCQPLTMADPISRYILAIKAGRSTSVDEARPSFEYVFREYGVPEQILTDNGAPFCNRRALGGLTRLSKWWIDVVLAQYASIQASRSKTVDMSDSISRSNKRRRGHRVRRSGSSRSDSMHSAMNSICSVHTML